MARLDDFLAPLHQGVWEVVVPKESVTEPLDPGWGKSSVNVPSPGTLASFRKGQYHVHETADEWRVHLDRYDPKEHPLLHLVDDAPLLLMIGGTVVALATDTRKGKIRDTESILEEQKRSWQLQVLIGVALLLFGAYIITNPLSFYRDLIRLAVPLLIIVLGVMLVTRGATFRPPALISTYYLVLGVLVVLIGIVSFYLPIVVWSTVILGIVTLWGFGSAYMALRRVAHGRAAVPDGFYKWLVIGVLSFLLGVFILVLPDHTVAVIMMLVGAIALLLGITLIVNGARLRQWMHHPRQA
ncbi:uncharacterized membrane protein HdeD (DUF308 family) [Methanolinea mesophila]|uniref:HdeD family acid-resistance protein n=1 Tax=Methanolinea mesophila TaxID=547055 RepID=UPI001AE6BDAF|nr:DUF308 domain-containing protein [Methanolinea mesophila]MBP1928883.1 uncharacterized membrane protein HdeD (DUF308 family) [Methanolinea mesophila]